MFYRTDFLVTIIIFLLFFISPLSLANENLSTPSKDWLATNEDLIQWTSEVWREKYGSKETRYTSSEKNKFLPEFLEMMPATFTKTTKKTIAEFERSANIEMKNGLGVSTSRFTNDEKKFSEIYVAYLNQNLKLLKNEKPLTIENANLLMLKTLPKVLLGVRMTDFQQRVPVFTDANGRILFLKEIPEPAKVLLSNGKIFQRTLNYDVKNNSIFLVKENSFDKGKELLLQNHLDIFQKKRPPSDFKIDCKIPLEKLDSPF